MVQNGALQRSKTEHYFAQNDINRRKPFCTTRPLERD